MTEASIEFGNPIGRDAGELEGYLVNGVRSILHHRFEQAK